MRRIAILALPLAAALAACGSGDNGGSSASSPTGEKSIASTGAPTGAGAAAAGKTVFHSGFEITVVEVTSAPTPAPNITTTDVALQVKARELVGTSRALPQAKLEHQGGIVGALTAADRVAAAAEPTLSLTGRVKNSIPVNELVIVFGGDAVNTARIPLGGGDLVDLKPRKGPGPGTMTLVTGTMSFTEVIADPSTFLDKASAKNKTSVRFTFDSTAGPNDGLPFDESFFSLVDAGGAATVASNHFEGPELSTKCATVCGAKKGETVKGSWVVFQVADLKPGPYTLRFQQSNAHRPRATGELAVTVP
jgi:hypothetical protein